MGVLLGDICRGTPYDSQLKGEEARFTPSDALRRPPLLESRLHLTQSSCSIFFFQIAGFFSVNCHAIWRSVRYGTNGRMGMPLESLRGHPRVYRPLESRRPRPHRRGPTSLPHTAVRLTEQKFLDSCMHLQQHARYWNENCGLIDCLKNDPGPPR